MLRKYLPFLTAIAFVFCFVINSFAQDTTLQRILSRRQDTTTVNELIKYGLSLLNTDHKMARKVFTTALEKSRHLDYNYGIGTSYSRLGFIEGQEGRPKGAIAYNLKALPHFKKTGNVKGIATSYNNVGCSYDILGMGDSAIHFYIEGIKILEEHKTEQWLLTMLYANAGTLYCNRKEIPKAIFYSKKALN
jgi:tetratricopeptide (TPR) repeat protein